MDKRKKIINIILWTMVVIFILSFLILIVVEYSFSRNAVGGMTAYACLASGGRMLGFL